MQQLLATMPQVGKIEFISRRPERRAAVEEVESVEITEADGIVGDHYHGKSRKRQVTLIQKEHLDVVGSILQKEIDPKLTRRNIVVSGINLLACKEGEIQVGQEVVLEITGPCAPCSRMEENFGPGGYNAMRGHGGVTAMVIKGGTIKGGDKVTFKG